VKVLQINAVYGKKSTGTIVQDIDILLKESGNISYVAYQDAAIHIPNGYRIGNIVDWKFHALLTRITGKQGFYSRFATKKFLKYLEHIKPDIIHLHNLHANFINLPILLEYIRKQRIGLVITLHDCWYFTGKCFHFADIGCEKYKTRCDGCPKKNQDIPNLFIDNAYWVYKKKKELFSNIPNKKIIGCSKWIASLAEESFFEKVDYIYNGIDTRIFKEQDRNSIRQSMGIEQEFVILGMANKWGLIENEDVVKSLFQHYSLRNAVILIVGCDAETKQRFRTLSAGSKVKTILVEYVQLREELARYYACADVFVNLTHVDTLPTVNMESICCGTPVVTYNSGGSPELILSGCGYVVNKGEIS
jgi:glycosyltransferase involved in cell wall biosynthesis